MIPVVRAFTAIGIFFTGIAATGFVFTVTPTWAAAIIGLVVIVVFGLATIVIWPKSK